MNKLMSEVLFNRALLWLLLGWEESRHGANVQIVFVHFLISAYCVVMSIRKRVEVDA